MTDNKNFKEETTKLHDSLKAYKSKYRFVSGGKVAPTPIDLAVNQLRSFLEIVRTDDENAQQEKKDGMI